MSGEGDVNTIGEGSMNRSLIEARKDKNVKAIVLRINSPGGNALTSDLIWREIELTKKSEACRGFDGKLCGFWWLLHCL